MTTALVGLLALSIDIGRIYNASTEMNNAADAYALAGASQLDGEPGACSRAILAAANASLANAETFGSNMPGPDVFISPLQNHLLNPNIKFLSALEKDANGNVTGAYITDPDPAVCDLDADHIEVTLNLSDPNNPYRIDLMFAGVTGAVAQAFPKGYAIAQYGTANCITVPLMMCALDDAPAVQALGKSFMQAVTDYDLTGYGLWLKSEKANVQWGSGNFGFLRLDGAGAKTLGELIGGVNPDLDCLGKDEIETEPGNNSGARKYFNTRFDMWHGDVKSLDSDPNYQPAPNSLKGLVRSGGACTEPPGGGGYNHPSLQYTGPGSYGGPEAAPATAWNIDGMAVDAAMPHPRDKCAYPSPGGCEANSNTSRLGTGDWDRATYMEINHPGVAYDTGAPANDQNFWVTDDADFDVDWRNHPVNPGPAPDGIWTRYEMYLWELDREHFSYPIHNGADSNPPGTGFEMLGSNPRIPDNTSGLNDGPTAIPQTDGEYAGSDYLSPGSGQAYPQCFSGAMGNAGVDLNQDRRVVTAIVVDCDPSSPTGIEVKGKTDIPQTAILGTVDLFVLEPWKETGPDHDISTEIIGPGVTTGVAIEPIKKWVHLKEGRNALK